MIRNLKTLGLALVAVMALGVVGASAASAAEFTAESYPAYAEGTGGAEEFTTEAGTVKCSTSSYEGATMGEATASYAVHPTYSGCQAFGFVEASVNTNQCDYVFNSVTGSGPYSSKVDISCSGGSTIVITAATCTAKVGGQTGLSSVTLTNNGGNVEANPNVTNIAYTVTKDGFLCPFGGVGEKTDGEITSGANIVMEGFEEGGSPTNIAVE
jgi:hypothetical protein